MKLRRLISLGLLLMLVMGNVFVAVAVDPPPAPEPVDHAAVERAQAARAAAVKAQADAAKARTEAETLTQGLNELGPAGNTPASVQNLLDAENRALELERAAAAADAAAVQIEVETAESKKRVDFAAANTINAPSDPPADPTDASDTSPSTDDKTSDKASETGANSGGSRESDFDALGRMPLIPSVDALPGAGLSHVESGDTVISYVSGRLIPRLTSGLMVFVTIAALLFTVISGVQFVVAMGNQEQATQARKALVNALAGLVIALLAVSIVSVISRLDSILDPSVSHNFFIEEAYAADVRTPEFQERLDGLLPNQKEIFGTASDAPRLVGQKGEDLFFDLAPRIVKVVLALGGSVVFVVFAITGIRLIYSQGDEEELGEVKKTFTYTAVGLSVIVASYAIVFGILKLFDNF